MSCTHLGVFNPESAAAGVDICALESLARPGGGVDAVECAQELRNKHFVKGIKVCNERCKRAKSVNYDTTS